VIKHIKIHGFWMADYWAMITMRERERERERESNEEI